MTHLETVRLLLALAAKNDWQVHHLHVKTTFLNGELTEDVFVAQPEGYEKHEKGHLVYVFLMTLRQAPRAWYAKLNQSLECLVFKRCYYENNIHTNGEGNNILIIVVYVDDILITGGNMLNIKKFKVHMGNKFEMTNLGRLSYYR